MRTTLTLPDALVEAAKEQARAEGRTPTSVIEDAMRRRLEQSAGREPYAMPTFGMSGGNGLRIDILDREALDDAFEADDAS